MKEEPNTQIYCNYRIIRVVFVWDEDRDIYWFDFALLKSLMGIPSNAYHCLHSFNEEYIPSSPILQIEDWRIENNLPIQPKDWDKAQWAQFKLRWL